MQSVRSRKLTFLEIKHGFADKKGLYRPQIEAVLEIREKAIKVKTQDDSIYEGQIVWIPKSCLALMTHIELIPEEIDDSMLFTDEEMGNLEGIVSNVDEAIDYLFKRRENHGEI